MKTKLLTLSTVALLTLGGVDAAAQFSIDWQTISGSSGASAGGSFSLNGTAGQPAAHAQPLSGGNFSLVGGFWSFMAIQMPDAPLLSIQGQGADVRVFWPLPATSFVLDESVSATGVWSQVQFPYTTNATEISVQVPAAGSSRFFRLRKP